MTEISDADRFTSTHLEKTLPTIREPLFRMADQVLAAADERRWNLIVSDDTNGRIPTYFVRKALEGVRQEHVPILFLNASKDMRQRLDKGDYIEYVAGRLDPLDEYRPLIVTESVGEGAAISHLKDVLEDAVVCQGVDAATVAAPMNHPEFLHYVGSQGNQPLLDVFFCLEAIAGTSLKARTLTKLRRMIPPEIKHAMPQRLHAVGRPETAANVLTGLYTPDNPLIPISGSDRVHHIGTAYAALGPLIGEYVETRGAASPRVPATTSVIMEEHETI